MPWTDELMEKLRMLWEKGLPASAIAEALGGGISRNAVIGKAHRLGLEARPSPVKTADQPGVRPRPAPKAEKAPKPHRTSLLELSDKVCKWPVGHPGDADFHFCGKPSQAGYPYCGEHCAVAYQAQLPRRDRPGMPPPRAPIRMR